MASQATDLPAFIVKHLDDIATGQGFTDYQIHHEAGSKTGDGFMAEMLAVTLDGNKPNADGRNEPLRLSLICKLQPSDKLRQEQFKCSWVFAREVLMYNRVLPFLDRMQRDQGLNEWNGFFAYPKCYFASFDPENESESIVIMEDLRASGFSLWDKTKVSPPENVKLLLEQLGRLHALSFVLRDQQPEVLAALAAELTEIHGPIIRVEGFQPIFQSGFTRAAKLMEQQPHAGLFRRMNERWQEMHDAAFDVGRYERFAVLTHGDLWCNNMMFVLDEGIGRKVSIIDWQVGHMRSPAFDISNFLVTVTDSVTRAKHMNDYLDTYYTNVAATIRAFGSDPERLFSRADFDEQLRQNAFYGIINGPMSLPCLVCDPTDISDMGALAADTKRGDTDDLHLAVLDDRSEVLYRAKYCEVVEDADRYGWLDVLKTL